MELDGQAEKCVDVGVLVKREQASAIAASSNLTLIGSCFVVFTAVALSHDRIPQIDLIIWTAAVIIINILRMTTSLYAISNKLIRKNPGMYLRINWLGALASGLCWASFLVLVFFYGLALDPAVTFIICGISAGSFIQSSTHRATVWAFILPIAVVQFLGLVSLGTIFGTIYAVNVLIYTTMLCRSSRLAETAFTSASRLKHEATDLAQSLKVANTIASASAKRMEYVANHDPLTGLFNRTAFNNEFNRAIDMARLDRAEVLLLLIDLDRFKAINDTFGHGVGDDVLVEVARRLREDLGQEHFVARLGGDEFAVVLDKLAIEQFATSLPATLIETVSQPITVSDRQLTIGASIGFALYPRDGYSVEELQICADVALYAAKSEGRGIARGFDEKLRAATEARRVFELDLAEALANGSLEVWFQPQVRLSDHRLCGLESLLRWNHPNHGWVPPPEIVSAAAATRQSEALTGFVVAASCRMIQALNLAGHSDVMVSFNASPQELGHYSLAALIARQLASHNVSSDRLEVEVTEEAMLSEERGGGDLRAIAAMGVKIAIDDFGVGYSSFGALKSLKFDCIKIDRVFVEGVTENADDRALIQAILGVARALGVKAIAEGAETAEQVAMLASLGCHEVQGYYFARPMPAKSVLEWIAARSEQAVEASPQLPQIAPDKVRTARTAKASR